MTDERWRCFVAVPVGEALREDLRGAMDGWRNIADLRWTDPDGWHVTLNFLGSIEPASAPDLVERLGPVAKAHQASRIGTGGIGAFPSPARARVAWYGVADEHDWLAQLARDVAVALDLDDCSRFDLT